MTTRANLKKSDQILRALMIGGTCAAVSLLFAAGLWPRWNALHAAHAATETGGERPSVLYVEATPAKSEGELVLPGSIRPFQEVTLYARTNGYVKRWHADLGDQVKAGALLAELEAPELDREIDQARAVRTQVQANLALARITSERHQALLKDEAVAPQEADEKLGVYTARKADLTAVEANLRRLEQLKSFQRISAPIDGRITGRNLEVGTLVQSGPSASGGWLYRLTELNRLRVQVGVPQNYAALIKEGGEAELLVSELGHSGIQAKVARSAGSLDPVTRSMVVELHVDNAGHKIMPGMYGQVKFRLAAGHARITIPATALMVTGDGLQVATLDSGDAVRIKKVKVGRDDGKAVEILSGLSAKERVVNNPRDNLEDGMVVKAVLQKKAEKKVEPATGGKPEPKPSSKADSKPESKPDAKAKS